jgi:hypothetical protein
MNFTLSSFLLDTPPLYVVQSSKAHLVLVLSDYLETNETDDDIMAAHHILYVVIYLGRESHCIYRY